MTPISEVSETTLRRLPVYLHYLTRVQGERKNISASMIAAHFGLNDVQVRKDLAAISGTGRPKTGYDVTELIGQIQHSLDCGSETKAILVGAGNLGRALLSYAGFADFGLNIVAAFDTDMERIGMRINGKPVLSLDTLERVCFDEQIRLGIITVPVAVAQDICDRLVRAGTRAIWNFSPTILKTPPDVLTENENLASSLAILSRHLQTWDGEAQK